MPDANPTEGAGSQLALPAAPAAAPSALAAAPAAEALPPPPVRPAGARAKAAAKTEADLPTVTPEAEAAALARLGIGSADEVDAYRAWRRAQEEAKPDVKLAKENERLQRAAAAASQETEKWRKLAGEHETALARQRDEHAEREFSLWLDGFAASLGSHAGLVPEAADDLREYLDRRFRAEGEGAERRMVFTDGALSLPVGKDAGDLRTKLTEHVQKVRPHWIGSRARPTTPSGQSLLPAFRPAAGGAVSGNPHDVLAARLIADKQNGTSFGRRP